MYFYLEMVVEFSLSFTVIADIISLGHALTVVIPEGPAAELRKLAHARERAIKQRTSMVNQLRRLLSVVFPEFLQVMKNVKTKTALYLLKRHPGRQDIVALGRGPLAALLSRTSMGKIGQERASCLFEAARGSIGASEGSETHFHGNKTPCGHNRRADQVYQAHGRTDG